MSLPVVAREAEGQLLAVARAAIQVSLLDAWNRSEALGRQPHEPDVVATLVLDGVQTLENGWAHVLRPFGIRLSLLGVFCHQTPQVLFSDGGRGRCELGDLLVCHLHESGSGNVRRNALLLQAKMSSVQPCPVGKRDGHQLQLYRDWPEFTYVSGPLRNRSRNVTPHSEHRGAQYLLIDDRPPHEPLAGLMGIKGTYPIGVSMPDSLLRDHASFDRELVDLLFSLSGRAFEGPRLPAAEIGWSRVVWDIIGACAGKAFRRIRSGHIGAPRTWPADRDGDWFCAASTDLRTAMQSAIGSDAAGGDAPPVELLDTNADSEDGWAPSLLLIRTSESEEPRE